MNSLNIISINVIIVTNLMTSRVYRDRSIETNSPYLSLKTSDRSSMVTEFRTRERRDVGKNPSKRAEQKEEISPERMQNRAWRSASGVRITKKLHASQFYRRQRRWAKDEESGRRGAGRKFTSEDLAGADSCSPLGAVAGPRAAPNGVTLKERRATEIIPDNHHYMQSPAQSSTQYRQRDATVATGETEDRYGKKKKKEKEREGEEGEGRSW